MSNTKPFPRTVKNATQQPIKPNGTTVFGIDDGTREITLVNNYGKVICKLHFRTGEVAILDRFNDLMVDFPKMVAPLNEVNINADGSAADPDNSDGWKKLKLVEANLKKKLNELLDMDEADEIFKTRSPFSSIGGEFFVEKVLTAIGQAITAQIKEEAELSQARIHKYVQDVNDAEVMGDAGELTDNT